MGAYMKHTSEASPQMVVFSVLFYIVTSIVMVLVNKAVLNVVELPITFLVCQMAVAVLLLHVSAFFGLFQLPSVEWSTCKRVIPLVFINVVGLSFNTLCLQYVDASYYQVARAFVLPLTVILSFVYLKQRQNATVGILISCAFICMGFLVGTQLETQVLISSLGVFLGLCSSFTTALHSIVIKTSLDVVQGNTLHLVYYNNLLSLVGFLPVFLLSGEYDLLSEWAADMKAEWAEGDMITLKGSQGPITDNIVSPLKTFHFFMIGVAVTGIFGFLINVAGFLQIKVTSPVTHMISSAVRGVLQTILAAMLFGDLITSARISGIFLILTGSCLYTWTKMLQQKQQEVPAAYQRV